MTSNNIGGLIAKRTLTYGDRKITIRIGKPQPIAGTSYYDCFYQIRGIGNDRTRNIPGIDPIHAIQGVLEKIGIDLFVLNESLGWKLRWEGGADDRDLGFPLSGEIMAILEGRDSLPRAE